MAYALGLLFIFLGMLAICLPRLRKKDVGPAEDQPNSGGK